MAEYKSTYTGAEIDAGIAKANTAIQDVSNKQDTLVSGTNIKTINNTSILGSGNITIEGGSGDVSTTNSNFPFELSDENGNTIFRIDEDGNLITSSFSSGTSVARIPTTSVAGKYLTSTDTEGVMEWTNNENAKTLKVPFLKEQHRGWSSPTVHENTLPAFKRAWLNGADMIELDARLSADNVYICAHDATITVDGTTYTIANTNSDVLTNLTLSTDSVYGACKVPLTETILRFCAHAGMMCNLDCKSINAQTIAELVNKCGMSGKVMYANLSTSDALDILNYDKHAMFLFNYSNLSSWQTALANNKEVLERSWCWAYSNTNLASSIATARAVGVKFLIAGISSYNATIFALQPDCFEFTEPTDCNAVCEQYLESLNY